MIADFWVVVVTLAFFGVCVAMVWGCDRIIGPDEPSEVETAERQPAPDAAEAVR